MRLKSLRALLSINMIVDKHRVAHTLSFNEKSITGHGKRCPSAMPIAWIQYSNMRVVNMNQLKIWNGI